jgi:hypothetical protein
MQRDILLTASIGLIAGSLIACNGAFDAQAAQPPTEHALASRPETLSWGWFPLDKPPVLTIVSGDTVSIDTLSHAGATPDRRGRTHRSWRRYC